MATPYSKRQKLDEDKLEAIRIPEDVIREILVRLPIQSIPRFKLTCKSWYALIRSRSLIELHRRFHRHDDHQNQLFFYDDQGEHNYHVDAMNSSSFQSTPVFEIRNLLRALKSVTPAKIRVTLTRAGIDLPLEMIAQVFEPCINVLGPLSNGIFCVVAQVYATTGDLITYGYSNAAFCNPATGEFQLISPPHVFKRTIEPPHGFLLFNDDCPPALARKVYARYVLEVKQHYGFGSIIEKGTTGDVVVDYKMVMIMQYSERFPPRKKYSDWFKVFVYSQRRGIWKLICDSESSSSSPWRFQFQFPTITQDLDFLPQATLNGSSCHWMTDEHSILRFDLANEEFCMIPGPPDEYINLPPALVKRPGVFVLNDHLAAIVMRYRFDLFNTNSDCDIDVWVMKEYGVKESWTKIESCTFHLGSGLRLQKFLGMFFSGDISHGSITIERMFFQIKRGELLSHDCFGRIVTNHSISGRILKKDSTAARLKKLDDVDDDDDDGGGGGGGGGHSTWYCLKRLLANDVYDRSLVCWKTIGLSAYVETLEPVALECTRDMDEDEDSRQQGNNRNAI